MTATTVRASIEVPLDPATAFAMLAKELATGLAQLGLRFEAGPAGRVTEGAVGVGRVVA